MKNLFVYNKEHTTSNEQNGKKKRKRKIIWFILTYSNTIEINNGKHFHKLVKPNFPKQYKLQNI